MQYLGWALIALLAYTFVAPLVSLATNEIPAEVVIVVTNGMLVAVAIAVLLVSDASLTEHTTDGAAPYMYGAGVALTVGIIAYYYALEAGPVSVVVPVFGTFLVLSSLIGVVFLDEAFTIQKAVGVVLAGAAIWLVST